MKPPREYSATRPIPARAERIRGILLDPAAMPDWNPALLALTGGGPAVVGHRYPIVLRGGFHGRMVYRSITDSRVDIDFDLGVGRENGWWELTDQPEAGITVVRHAFVHPGLAGRIMAGAFRGVAELRVGRLDDRIRGR